MSWLQRAKDNPSALLLFVQLGGVLYIAMVITLLVGLSSARGDTRAGHEQPGPEDLR